MTSQKYKRQNAEYIAVLENGEWIIREKRKVNKERSIICNNNALNAAEYTQKMNSIRGFLREFEDKVLATDDDKLLRQYIDEYKKSVYYNNLVDSRHFFKNTYGKPIDVSKIPISQWETSNWMNTVAFIYWRHLLAFNGSRRAAESLSHIYSLNGDNEMAAWVWEEYISCLDKLGIRVGAEVYRNAGYYHQLRVSKEELILCSRNYRSDIGIVAQAGMWYKKAIEAGMTATDLPEFAEYCIKGKDCFDRYLNYKESERDKKNSGGIGCLVTITILVALAGLIGVFCVISEYI